MSTPEMERGERRQVKRREKAKKRWRRKEKTCIPFHRAVSVIIATPQRCRYLLEKKRSGTAFLFSDDASEEQKDRFSTEGPYSLAACVLWCSARKRPNRTADRRSCTR